MAAGGKNKFRPIVHEKPQSRAPILGRGASWSPANRFEKLHVDLTDTDVVDADPEADPPSPTASPARTYGAAREKPRRPTQYFRDSTKTIIARNQSPDVGFETSINPYRGCEHGCIYCFARPTHEYLGFSAGLDFESRIMVKPDAPRLLAAELSSPKWKPQLLMMSGVTDCYQPVERKLRITRRCLEVIAKFRNPVAILTKNRLVTRDIDILSELARYNAVVVNLSITTLDLDLQHLPAMSSSVTRRKAVDQALRDAGIEPATPCV